MNFKEWVKIHESPSLFGGNIWQQVPGTQRVNPKNWDMMQPSQLGGGGGVTPSKGAAPYAPMLTGSGPGLGNQQPKRSKKMKT
jgi:hypothetical protein